MKPIIFSNLRLLMIIPLIIAFGCQKDNVNGGSNGRIKINWISGGTNTLYSYSSGVISSYTFQRSFSVTQGSGELEIEVKIEGDNTTKVSEKFTVENGKTYVSKVHGSINGRQSSSPGNSCMKVVFSSDGSSQDQKITIDSYLVPSYNEWIPDTYYCPKAITLSGISVTEKEI